MTNETKQVRTRGGWIPAGTSASRRERSARAATDRGRRTRRRLLDAARRVFEENGYLDASVDDVVSEAGLARGSFYTYFPSKLDIFRELAQEVEQAIHASVKVRPTDINRDVISNLERSNRRYVAAYRDNAALYGLIEQVSTVDPEVQRARLESRKRHVNRVAGSISRWQQLGLADPNLDPSTVAGALVSMMSNFTYWRLVGDDEYDEEASIEVLMEIWIRSLDLTVQPRQPVGMELVE